MRNQKYYIAIDEHERRVIVGSLNNLRNKLIAGGRNKLLPPLFAMISCFRYHHG